MVLKTGNIATSCTSKMSMHSVASWGLLQMTMLCWAACAHLCEPIFEALLANIGWYPVSLLIVGNQAVFDLCNLHKPAGHCLHQHATSVWMIVS